MKKALLILMLPIIINITNISAFMGWKSQRGPNAEVAFIALKPNAKIHVDKTSNPDNIIYSTSDFEGEYQIFNLKLFVNKKTKKLSYIKLLWSPKFTKDTANKLKKSDPIEYGQNIYDYYLDTNSPGFERLAKHIIKLYLIEKGERLEFLSETMPLEEMLSYIK